jgi:hypothetical protein
VKLFLDFVSVIILKPVQGGMPRINLYWYVEKYFNSESVTKEGIESIKESEQQW